MDRGLPFIIFLAAREAYLVYANSRGGKGWTGPMQFVGNWWHISSCCMERTFGKQIGERGFL